MSTTRSWRGGRGGIEQPELTCPRHSGFPVMHVEVHHELLDLLLHGGVGEAEPHADLEVGVACAEQSQHLELAVGNAGMRAEPLAADCRC